MQSSQWISQPEGDDPMRPTIAGLAILAAIAMLVPPRAHGDAGQVERVAARGTAPDGELKLQVELRFDQATGALVCLGYRTQDKAQDGLLRQALVESHRKPGSGPASPANESLNGGESDVIMMALPQYGPESAGDDAARRGELDAITLTLPTDGLHAALQCKHGSPMG
jgi:hypothetical protein